MTDIDNWARLFGYGFMVGVSVAVLCGAALVLAAIAQEASENIYREAMRLMRNHQSAAIILRWHSAWKRGEPMPEEVKAEFRIKGDPQ